MTIRSTLRAFAARAPSQHKYDTANEADFRHALEAWSQGIVAALASDPLGPSGISIVGTTNRVTVTGTYAIDISASYVGQASITTLGTITTGVWNGTSIGTAYTDAKVVSVAGTASRITSSGGSNPAIDISASYVGQASITTLGTITTGVWDATAIAWAKVDKTGSSLADLTTRSAGALSSGNLDYARMPTGAGTWNAGSGVVLNITALSTAFSGSFTGGMALTTENTAMFFSINSGTNAGANDKVCSLVFHRGGSALWYTGLYGTLGTEGAYRLVEGNTNTAVLTAYLTGLVEIKGDLALSSAGAVRRTTSDGSDNSYLDIAGGGAAFAATRGAYIRLYGNEEVVNNGLGNLILASGSASGAGIQLRSEGNLIATVLTTGLTVAAGKLLTADALTVNAGPVSLSSGRMVVPASTLDPVTIGADVVIGTDPGGTDALRVGSAINVTTRYAVGGTQVVGAQGAAVADASGGTVIDTEARAALNALLARVRTHGLIAT